MKRTEIRKLINWAKIHKKYYLMRKIWDFNSRLYIENTDILFWKEVLNHPKEYEYEKNNVYYTIDYVLNNE